MTSLGKGSDYERANGGYHTPQNDKNILANSAMSEIAYVACEFPKAYVI